MRRGSESGRWRSAGLVLVAVAAVVAAAATAVSWRERRAAIATCRQNLETVGQVYYFWQQGGRARHNATGWLISLRNDRRANVGGQIAGNEELFLCPSDPLAERPLSDERRAAYDNLDLDAPPRWACSYPMREFKTHPLDAVDEQEQPVVICPHHHDVVLVLWLDGRVTEESREEHGLPAGAAPEVGPAFDHPMFGTMCYRPAPADKR